MISDQKEHWRAISSLRVRWLMLVLEPTFAVATSPWSSASTAKHNDAMLLYAFGYPLAMATQLPCPATE
jgi:hypothetical protein